MGMEELRALWTDLQARGEWYDGCTHIALVQRYGAANLKHKLGHGWYKLTEARQ